MERNDVFAAVVLTIAVFAGCAGVAAESAQESSWYLNRTQDELAAIQAYVDDVIAGARSPSRRQAPPETDTIFRDFQRIIIEQAKEAREIGDWQRIAEIYLHARRFGVTEGIPPLSSDERARMIESLQDQQDPKTGRFRDNNAIRLLYEWGGVPREPMPALELGDVLTAKGPDGLEPVEVETYLERSEKDPDWKIGGWAVGSHMGSQSHALLKAIDDGHTNLIPVLERGIGLILSHQDPETGLFGPPDAEPGHRISGNLKVLGRLCGYMGMDIPRIKPLVDTLIDYSNKGVWYGRPTALYARNVAEVTALCLEQTEYRREELYGVLERVAADLCDHWRKGLPGHLHLSRNRPVAYGLGICGDYLNWPGFPIENPLRRVPLFSRGAAHRFRVELQKDGHVAIVAKKPDELVWNQPRYRAGTGAGDETSEARQKEDEESTNLLFCASLVKSLDADFARGNPAAVLEDPLDEMKFSKADGRAGVFLGRSSCVKYEIAGNFNRESGTVMCWFCPSWPAGFQDRRGRILWDLRIEHGSVVPDDPSQRWAIVFPNPADRGSRKLRRWRFCVATKRNRYKIGTNEKSKDVSRQCVLGSRQSFQAGEWMHLAVTWTKDKGAIYVNGALDAEKHLKEGLPDKLLPVYMQLGAVESWINAGAVGILSDVRIYGRELTETEVKEAMQSRCVFAETEDRRSRM